MNDKKQEGNNNNLATPRDYGLVGFFIVAALIAGFFVASRTVQYLELSDVFKPKIFTLWLMGALSLGLVSGYVTGASPPDTAGKTEVYLTFLSTGVVTPLFAAIATLIGGSGGPALAIALLGGFFFFYSLFAVIGFLIGAWGRDHNVRLALRSKKPAVPTPVK